MGNEHYRASVYKLIYEAVQDSGIPVTEELDSLTAVVVAAAVEEKLGVMIDRYIPTITQTVDYIVSKKTGAV